MPRRTAKPGPLTADDWLEEAESLEASGERHLFGEKAERFFQKARTAYQRALELNPDDADALFNLGRLEQHLATVFATSRQTVDIVSSAVVNYRAALQLDPTSIDIRFNLAQALCEVDTAASLTEAIQLFDDCLSEAISARETDAGAVIVENALAQLDALVQLAEKNSQSWPEILARTEAALATARSAADSPADNLAISLSQAETTIALAALTPMTMRDTVLLSRCVQELGVLQQICASDGSNVQHIAELADATETVGFLLASGGELEISRTHLQQAIQIFTQLRDLLSSPFAIKGIPLYSVKPTLAKAYTSLSSSCLATGDLDSALQHAILGMAAAETGVQFDDRSARPVRLREGRSDAAAELATHDAVLLWMCATLADDGQVLLPDTATKICQEVGVTKAAVQEFVEDKMQDSRCLWPASACEPAFWEQLASRLQV